MVTRLRLRRIWPVAYLINNGITPPAFDPFKLESVTFHVTANADASVPYSFCIGNIIMLTN